jgi:hypothetical protein
MFSRMLTCKMLGFAAVLFSVCWQATAQETSEAQKPAAAEAAKQPDIATLIKQLDADEYNERQSASAKLAAAGENAVPALEKAASSDSREMSMRAFDILKGHFDKGTPTVKHAAKQALERISKSDLGGASRRAAEALAPPTANIPNNPARNARVLPFAPAPGGIRIAGARVVIAAGAVGGGVETKIKVENGVKTTEVKDKDRQVKIVDDPDKGLQLEVTETKDGKETTQKYEAKNADELKTKHAEAHKIYEQYSQKGAEIKIGGFGFAPAVPLPIGPVPAIAPARLVPVAPALPPMAVPAEIAPPTKKPDAFEGLDKAIQEAEASLKEALKQSGGDSEQLKRAQLRLEEVRKQLEQLRSAQK